MNVDNTKKTSLLHQVASREWKRLWSRPSLYLPAVVLPLVCFVIFSMIYQKRTVTDIPIAVMDMEQSANSRSLTDNLDATRGLAVEMSLYSLDDIKQAMLSGKVHGALIIPEDFSASLVHNRTAHAVFYKNAGNIILSNTMYRDVQAVMQTWAAGKVIKSKQAKGMTATQAMAQTLPLVVKTVSTPNWGYSYELFLLTGLLPMITLLCTVLFATLLYNVEVQENTFQELVQCAQGRLAPIMIGKALPYIATGIMQILIMVAIIFPVFRVYLQHPAMFSIFMILLLSAGYATGSLISACTRDVLFANDVALFLTAPSMIFCGYTFPLTAMPLLHTTFAQILPFTHFIHATLLFEDLHQFQHIVPDAVKLILFSIIGFSITAIALKKKITENS